MKAVIFDMDGVIIDSEPMHTAVAVETMAHYGATVTATDMERFAGMTMRAIFSTLKEENHVAAPVEDIMARQEAGILRHVLEDDDAPIDGIRQLLSALKEKRIPAAVASSSPLNLIQAVVTKFGIKDDFSHLVSGEEVSHGKPRPDVYLEAARRLGVAPADCLVIEDSKNGTIAAKSAGMTCIGFKNPNSGDQDLSRADVVVSALTDIDLDKF